MTLVPHSLLSFRRGAALLLGAARAGFGAGRVALGCVALAVVAPAAFADDVKPAPSAPPAEPGMGDPGMAEPAMDEPAMDDPAMDDPAMGDPAMADPAPAAADAAPKRGGIANPFHDPKASVTIKDAEVEAGRLKDLLKKSKSDNQDILASLDALAKAYANLVPNDDAAKATFEADSARFHKEAEKLFLDAFELKYVKPNTSANLRDDVNIKAAQILGWCRPEVTNKIIAILETKIFKAKDYDPPTTLYDEAFKAIALLNTKDGFNYCLEWVKYSTNKGDAERTKAMYEAIILFTDVKGTVRHDFVKKSLISFIGTESSAERGRTKEEQTQKVVWDKVKGAIIKAMQVYCKEPKAKDGVLMAKLRDFNDWFRDHDSPRDPTWVDPKVVGDGK
ncbi:MAG: hypothetical protein JNM10_18465 [Planctomycetia bacterium]|nr:hypothetical protein [Planctomycetia bacterium]